MEPTLNGHALNIWEYITLKLVILEGSFRSLNERMVGIKRVLAGINYGFIEIHAGAYELIKTSNGREEGCNLVELNHGWAETNKLQGLIATKTERNFLIKTMVGTGFARVKLAKVWLSDA